MDMTAAFPGAHYKAADIMNGPIVLTIASVAMGKVGDDQKPIMKFYEGEQDLVLNVTNANTIIETYGKESSVWVGKQIELFAAKAQFGADTVDAVRVRVPVAGTVAPAATASGPVRPAPSAAPAPVVQHTMTALAAGATYEQFVAQGWTDEQLIAQGYMLPQAAPATGYPTAPAPLTNPLG